MDLQVFRNYCIQKHIPLIREESAKLLFNTAKNKQPQTVLEIGTGYGFSACITCLACNCKVYTIDIDEQRQIEAKRFCASLDFADRVEFFCGDALDIVPKTNGKYDMIFLDGAKSQYLDLLPYLIDCLCDKGVLVCDNVNYLGLTAIADTLPNNHKHITIARKMAEFVKKITTDERLETIVYNIEDGISVSVKK